MAFSLFNFPHAHARIQDIILYCSSSKEHACAKIAKDFKKSLEKGKELKLLEQELAFYDLLSSKEKFFENYKQIKEVAKRIVRELGYYIKVADWNRKEYVKAKIRTAVKNLLIRVINGKATYSEIEQLSAAILTHAQSVYARARARNQKMK